MATNMASEAGALSRLFSPKVLGEMMRTGRSPTFVRLLFQTGVMSTSDSIETVSEAFDAAFNRLRRSGWRGEYVYRAAVVQKILIGRHSLRTASMLSEFRAGASKADLVILNGTATAYEIKSERDSLSRLKSQVESYMRVFAAVTVIASEEHVPDILATVPSDVGVLCLSKRYRIQTVRMAVEDANRVSPIAIFEALRVSEAKQVLLNLGVAVPSLPNTLIHVAMRELFSAQEPSEVHHAAVSVLKTTRNLSPLDGLLFELPSSLHALALSARFKKGDYERLVSAVSTQLDSAKDWK